MITKKLKTKDQIKQVLLEEMKRISLELTNSELQYTNELEEFKRRKHLFNKYTQCAKMLATLDKDEGEWVKKISPDAILAVVGNLAGIALILNFERMEILTSRAIGFVMKTRL